MSFHILFEGIYFVLTYSTHIWNAYVNGNLLEIKNRKNEACLSHRQSMFNYFEKKNPTLKIVYNWLYICGAMLAFF